MLKKSSVVKYAAIASAVAAACGASYGWAAATAANAGPTSSGSAANVASATTADMVNHNGNLFSVRTVDTTYAVNDVVTLTFAGGSLRSAASAITPVQIDCTVSAGGSSMVLGFLNRTSNSVTYRVLGTGTGSIVNGSYAQSPSGVNCNFPSSQYSVTRNSATTIGACSVTVQYRANQGGETGTAFDSTDAVGIFNVERQFTTNVVTGSGFSGTVDVNAARLAWTGSAVSRSLVLSVNDNSATSTAYFATDAQTTHTYAVFGAGNGTENAFAFLDDDGNGCTNDDLTAGNGRATVSAAAIANGSLTISSNCATLTFTGNGLIGSSGTAATNGKTITLSLLKSTATTGLVIADGSFTVSPSFSVQISSTAVQSVTAFSGGSFGINGLVATVPYMPYGLSGTSEITQAWYITNRASAAGNVTAVAFNAAGSSCNLGTVGTAAARAVTNLSDNINNAIKACFPGNQRVYVTLTSATPAASTEVFASYNVGGNQRVNVTNDSYKTYSRGTP